MKHLAIILFLLLSISFVAIHIVSPQVDVSQELIEDDSVGKGSNEETETSKQKDAKGKFADLFGQHFLFFTVEAKLPSTVCHHPLMTGYGNQPYTPPDLF